MEPLSERFERALITAHRLHAGQARKGEERRIPYVSHLLAVAATVLEQGGSENAAIVALLHDAIEDQAYRGAAEIIEHEFGTEILGLVVECSDSDGIKKADWPTRKSNYIASIPTKTPTARLVTAADKLHNARCILGEYRIYREQLWKRFDPQADQVWYYRSLIRAFRQPAAEVDLPGTQQLVDELEKVIVELEGLRVSRQVSGADCSART